MVTMVSTVVTTTAVTTNHKAKDPLHNQQKPIDYVADILRNTIRKAKERFRAGISSFLILLGKPKKEPQPFFKGEVLAWHQAALAFDSHSGGNNPAQPRCCRFHQSIALGHAFIQRHRPGNNIDQPVDSVA